MPPLFDKLSTPPTDRSCLVRPRSSKGLGWQRRLCQTCQYLVLTAKNRYRMGTNLFLVENDEGLVKLPLNLRQAHLRILWNHARLPRQLRNHSLMLIVGR